MLASMRLCANVPAQYAIQTALGGFQSMQALTEKGGRLYEQRRLAVDRLNAMPGVLHRAKRGVLLLPNLTAPLIPSRMILT